MDVFVCLELTVRLPIKSITVIAQILHSLHDRHLYTIPSLIRHVRRQPLPLPSYPAILQFCRPRADGGIGFLVGSLARTPYQIKRNSRQPSFVKRGLPHQELYPYLPITYYLLPTYLPTYLPIYLSIYLSTTHTRTAGRRLVMGFYRI